MIPTRSQSVWLALTPVAVTFTVPVVIDAPSAGDVIAVAGEVVSLTPPALAFTGIGDELVTAQQRLRVDDASGRHARRQKHATGIGDGPRPEEEV